MSKACVLADVAIEKRAAARIGARLEGSALMHMSLIARDLYVYKSFAPFTLENMAKEKRRKAAMVNKSADLTDDDVCAKLVESSAKSNKAYTKRAKELGEQYGGYAKETIWIFLWPLSPNSWPIVGIVLLAYVVEAICAYPRKSLKD